MQSSCDRLEVSVEQLLTNESIRKIIENLGAVPARERTSCLPASRYLSEEEVLDTANPFEQLLSGVVWLIRNGSIYINESQATECDETQETGQEGSRRGAFFFIVVMFLFIYFVCAEDGGGGGGMPQ